MTKPLAVVAYERLLPGSQLCLKLGDLGYRVLHLRDLLQFIPTVEREKPMVVLLDLIWDMRDACICISQLKANEALRHVAVIAFADVTARRLREQALIAGANLVADDAGIRVQLPNLLDQALDLE